jgi:hypothetical protein
MYKSVSLCCLFLLLFSNWIYAQGVDFIIEKPQKFIVPSTKVNLEKDGNLPSGNTWVVFSDRPYNKTYTKPRGGKVKNILDYLEPFYVAAWEGDYLNIVREVNLEDDSIDSFEDYGWIHLDRLLLWNHCLTADNEINLKAIIPKNKNNIKLFYPDETESASFGIFYVYKMDKESVLLGRKSSFISDYTNVSDCIITWIPKSELFLWDDIQVIMPVVSERIADTICNPPSIHAYKDIKSAKKYERDCAYARKSLISIDRNQDSWGSNTLRFPVVQSENDIFEISIVKDIHKLNVTEREASSVFLPKKCGKCDQVFFKSQLLLSVTNLSRIFSVLNAFEDINRDSENMRQMIYAHWIGFLENEDIETNGIKVGDLPIGLVHNHFFYDELEGLIDPSLTVNSFLDESVVSNLQAVKYLLQIQESEKRIRAIINDRTPTSTFTSNGSLYYWVDMDYLP